MLNLSPRILSVALLSESFFCGALTVLFGVSVFRKIRTRTTYVLLAVNIVLYSISVLHWIVNSMVILGVVSMGRAATHILIEGLPVINYVLCDAVVVWRAWLIWECNTKICIPSFVCLVGTLASALISAIRQDDAPLALASLVWGFLLASNLWSTSIIAWRAWRHRQLIKALLGEGTARTNVEKILGLLIESGAVYCFIWSLYILIFYVLRSAAFIPAVILDQLVTCYPKSHP
ncbi:hypothetical protein HETIRDRAFT_426842 [Heterobasidion irregulare TC 32-1]|uniref:Uncharacterized protein n=1 Tax=Heterobasidion irregulare (strain TC 32-1) TaxID=747525 RepID=W4K6G0_HETIT|nr:uncharacterized protein HETIRDRAFT_426842 [Heterobasidion irregulare TC 32-1]ETW81412.1 hypothetical protein HETIRDRAFT_426842 [Heterobasidion irregulare TC 32-1]